MSVCLSLVVATQTSSRVLLMPAAAPATTARSVVFKLDGKREAPLSLSSTHAQHDSATGSEQQPSPAPLVNERKRRRNGVQPRRKRTQSPQPPHSPPPRSPATPRSEPSALQPSLQVADTPALSNTNPSSLSSCCSAARPSSAPPASPPLLPPPSPVFSVCDDGSEAQSPVYDYTGAATESMRARPPTCFPTVDHEILTDSGDYSAASSQQRSDELDDATALREQTEAASAATTAALAPPAAASTAVADSDEVEDVTPSHSGSVRLRQPEQLVAVAASAAAAAASVPSDDEVVVVAAMGDAAEDAGDAVVTDDVVTLLIDGRHERIDRSSQSQSLVAFQPSAVLPSGPASASTAGASLASGPSRRRARQSQLTFDTRRPVAASRSSASASDGGGAACVDEAVAGRVPALFQPRDREVQQRFSRIAAAGSAKKKSALPANGRATNADGTNGASAGGGSSSGGKSAGKRKVVPVSPSKSRPSSASPATAAPVAVHDLSDDSNQSRFDNCPLCGEVSNCPLQPHPSRAKTSNSAW